MAPRRSARLNPTSVHEHGSLINSNGRPERSRKKDNVTENGNDSPPSAIAKQMECTPPSTKRAKMCKSSLGKALPMQGSENSDKGNPGSIPALSNSKILHGVEEMQPRKDLKGAGGEHGVGDGEGSWSGDRSNGNGCRTPKKGCYKESDAPRSPKSPRKKTNNLLNEMPKWNPKDPSHVLLVKAALHLSAVPKAVICREKEQENIFEFCKMCIRQGTAGSLYVCGCPGTGKSLLLGKVKSLSVEWAKEAGVLPPNSVIVNCTSLTDTTDIFRKILEQCQQKKKLNANSSPFQELKSLVCERKRSSARKMMLLIIDEMDYLIKKDLSVLYDLFRLPTFSSSYCILIGIANAIDLTDRFLPKLQSLNCKPVVVTFRAYSKEQILRILQQRLMEVPYKVFQTQALELCARKVAAASGDMRKALHVCREAIEILETDLGQDPNEFADFSHENSMHLQLNAPVEGSLRKQEIDMVRLDHMAKSLAKTLQSAVVDTIQSLPQHQQMVLCSAVKLFRRGKKDATIGELNAAYLDFCKKASMHPITVPEFSSICRVLSDQALLKLGQSQEDRLKRVALKVDEEDVIFSLQGIHFFRNCLR